MSSATLKATHRKTPPGRHREATPAPSTAIDDALMADMLAQLDRILDEPRASPSARSGCSAPPRPGLVAFPVPSEHTVREVEASGKWVFGFFQRIVRLAAEQQRHGSLHRRTGQIAILRDEVRTFQAREGELIAKVEAEALRASAASASELARRIGYLEGRASRE